MGLWRVDNGDMLWEIHYHSLTIIIIHCSTTASHTVIFLVIKHCLVREASVVEELDPISILRTISCHQWTLSKGRTHRQSKLSEVEGVGGQVTK